MSVVAISHPLVLASHNAGKLREIEALLAPLGLTVNSAGNLGLPEPEETGDSFEANAALKAEAAARASGLTALADDSGLCIPALDGAPGIYSARWAGVERDFSAAMQRVARELEAQGIEPTGAPAYFVCVLAVADSAGNRTHVRGEVHGALCYPPRGAHGFGYDPMFIPAGHDQSFGEMEPAAKHAISHRTRAFHALRELLQQGQAA